MPEPYGVVGIILTWNGPLVSVGMKLIPALAAGNAVVMKPSELTPYATEHVMHLVREAGIPDGVVNLVLGGPETGEALVRHPLVQKVSFTGGPTAARKILAACAEFLKPAVLELGGKSADIVFPDADLDMAVAFNAFSVGAHAGRPGLRDSLPGWSSTTTFTTLSRSASCRWSTACSLGDPFNPTTAMSPVVSPRGAGTHPGDDRTGTGRRRRSCWPAVMLPAIFRTASSSSRRSSETWTRTPSSARSRCSGRCSR